jgi:hypothetical protein
MSGVAQNVVVGSLGVVGLMALASLADLITGAPFGGQTVPDIVFLIAAALTGYMGYDCLKKK